MFDAAVIGAGPSGSSAAIALARGGRGVALIEKNSGPKHKVCGEFFSPGIWPLLEKTGITRKMIAAGGRAVSTAFLYFPSQLPIAAEFPEICDEFPFAYALSRFSFDSLLLKQAGESGCEIITGTEVLAIREEKDFCALKLSKGPEIQARQVIVAAGRTHRFQKQKPGGSVGFKAHYQNMRKPAGLEMHFFRGGYLGLIEVEKGKINLCGILDRRLLKSCAGDFDDVLSHAAARNPRLQGWLGTAIRITPWMSCVTSNGFQARDTKRIWHTGDSACFVEPMIGQGMTLGIASGIGVAEKLLGVKKRPAKIYQSKLNYLRLFEPLTRLCSRFPALAKPWGALTLRDSLLRSLLSTP